MSLGQLHFTPVQATIGGVVLGATVVNRLFACGGVTGISGMIQNLFKKQPRSISFVCGLIGSGLALSMTPSAIASDISMLRFGIAGCFVSLGTFLANGCTSGHGICGLSRLSKRSFVAVASFMTCGAVVSTLTGTAQALGTTSVQLHPSTDLSGDYTQLLACAASTSLLFVLTGFLSTNQSPNSALALAHEFAAGVSFGMGLILSGMTNPSKVASFLTMQPGLWDPSLMFVMGGAVMVALPFFQYVLRKLVPSKATTLSGAPFNLPTNSTIDAKLVLGSALFGAGWGLCGICPGPALASLASLQPPILVFLGSYLGTSAALVTTNA